MIQSVEKVPIARSIAGAFLIMLLIPILVIAAVKNP